MGYGNGRERGRKRRGKKNGRDELPPAWWEQADPVLRVNGNGARIPVAGRKDHRPAHVRLGAAPSDTVDAAAEAEPEGQMVPLASGHGGSYDEEAPVDPSVLTGGHPA